MKKQVVTTNAPTPPAFFSQAIQAGPVVHVSGQGPQDPATGEYIAPGDVQAQTTRTLENIRAILEAAGTTFDEVISLRVFLTEQSNFAATNTAYEAFVTANCPSGVYPARTTIIVGLPNPAMLVEIDALAVPNT